MSRLWIGLPAGGSLLSTLRGGAGTGRGANPDLTLDRLLLNLLFTVFVIVGTLFEERDLVATFGEAYRSYQRKVPMLIPWRIRPGR